MLKGVCDELIQGEAGIFDDLLWEAERFDVEDQGAREYPHLMLSIGFERRLNGRDRLLPVRFSFLDVAPHGSDCAASLGIEDEPCQVYNFGEHVTRLGGNGLMIPSSAGVRASAPAARPATRPRPAAPLRCI